VPNAHLRQFSTHRHTTHLSVTLLTQSLGELDQRRGWVRYLQLLEEFAMLIVQFEWASAAMLRIRAHADNHRSSASSKSTPA
jgi:hypothetical protein